MKKVIIGFIAVCMIFQLTSCRLRVMERDEMMEFLDGLAENLGASQITGDSDLIGERLCGRDAYTGRYLAECDGNTGKDVVFGGGSIETRKVYICGYVMAYSGKATVRIRMNEDVIVLEPDEDGYFSTEVNMNSGGNYIMVNYENFTGTVDLTAGYAPLSGPLCAEV